MRDKPISTIGPGGRPRTVGHNPLNLKPLNLKQRAVYPVEKRLPGAVVFRHPEIMFNQPRDDIDIYAFIIFLQCASILGGTAGTLGA